MFIFRRNERMRNVKTKKELDNLRRAGAFPAALLHHIEGYFMQLRDELKDIEESKFCLGGMAKSSF
jgi:Xaa-Pro aminopeptidase